MQTFKETLLRSESLKTQNPNFSQRLAMAHETERYGEDN
jgi:hypothetical protein